jgi:hypothetical protein
MLSAGMCLPDQMRPEVPVTSRERPRCAACLDVVGVYEPLVHLLGGIARHSSRAAERAITIAGGKLYHLDCYESLEPA